MNGSDRHDRFPKAGDGAPAPAVPPSAPAPAPPRDPRMHARRPSETPAPPLTGFLSWLLAALGAAGSVLALQVAVALLGSISVVALASLFAPSVDVSASADLVVAALSLVSQLVTLAVFIPWWRHLRPVSFLEGRADRVPRPNAALAAAAVIVLGIGSQMLTSYGLGLLLPLTPDLQAEYHELMDTPVMRELTVLSALIVAVGPPIAEELALRGVVLEFSLRALCPQASPRWRDRRWRRETGEATPALPDVPASRFWIADAVQALLFALLHGNLVQGGYAFFDGLLFGWIVWRTGRLRYSILLHLTVNLSSFFVDPIARVLGAFGLVPAIAASAALVAAGIWLFARATGSASRRGPRPGRGAPGE